MTHEDKVKNLSKMMLIYQWLWMAEKKNKVVQNTIKKFKVSLSKTMSYKSKLYFEAQASQRDLYTKAWNSVFTKGQEKVISISALTQAIYETVDKEFADKMIGRRVMEKTIDSFFFADGKNYKELTDLEIEASSKLLTDAVLELYDGKKISAFKRRMTIVKQNQIIEGK